MTEAYELLIKETVGYQIKALRGKRKQAVHEFILSLKSNPFDRLDSWHEDHKGRIIETTQILDCQINYHIDHGLREVKILTIKQI